MNESDERCSESSRSCSLSGWVHYISLTLFFCVFSFTLLRLSDLEIQLLFLLLSLASLSFCVIHPLFRSCSWAWSYLGVFKVSPDHIHHVQYVCSLPALSVCILPSWPACYYYLYSFWSDLFCVHPRRRIGPRWVRCWVMVKVTGRQCNQPSKVNKRSLSKITQCTKGHFQVLNDN